MNGTGTIRRFRRQEWDVLVPLYLDACYRQCGAYAEAAARDVGARAEFAGIYKGDELQGIASIRVKAIPLLSIGLAYINHGPLTDRGQGFSPDAFAFCIEALKAEYVRKRGLLLRVAPPQGGGENNDATAACLTQCGLASAEGQQRLATYILDLDRPLNEIRAKFDKKWNSSLSRGERAGVQITRSQDSADFRRFESLYADLVERKGFHAKQGAPFFTGVSQKASSRDQLVVHLAWKDGQLIAGHVGSFVGDTALMLLGAAAPTGRDLMASFLLQWAVIQHAQASGNRFYDLGGVDPVANPDVYRFKKRLGGRPVTAVGAFDAAPSRARKLALDMLEEGWSYLRAKKNSLARARPALVGR